MNCLLCLYSASLPVDVLSSVSASHALLSRRSSRHYYPRSQPESSRHSGAVAQLVPTLLPSVTANVQSALRPCHAARSDIATSVTARIQSALRPCRAARPHIATLGLSQNPVSTQALSRRSPRHCYPRSQPESSQHSGPVTPLAPTLLPSVTANVQSALRPCYAARPHIAALGHSQNPVSTQALLRSSFPHCYLGHSQNPVSTQALPPEVYVAGRRIVGRIPPEGDSTVLPSHFCGVK